MGVCVMPTYPVTKAQVLMHRMRLSSQPRLLDDGQKYGLVQERSGIRVGGFDRPSGARRLDTR